MKKNFFSLAIVAMVIVLSSCSSKSSFESDVKKMANYQCEREKLRAKDQTDEKVKKEMEKLKKEMSAFGDKMEEKYKDKKDDKAMNEQADKIMEEVMAKCK
jgi:peptidoglycan hydrolase CwlO-like protein